MFVGDQAKFSTRLSRRQIISHTPDMPAGPWPWSKAGFLSFVLAEK